MEVSLASSAHAIKIIRAARKLKDSDKFENVFFCSDRTTEERDMRQQDKVKSLNKDIS